MSHMKRALSLSLLLAVLLAGIAALVTFAFELSTVGFIIACSIVTVLAGVPVIVEEAKQARTARDHRRRATSATHHHA